MARNRTPEYINRLRKTEAPNGFKFDIANYLYNPSLEHEYPHFTKKIAEDTDTETYKSVYYMKYYDGSGEYLAQTYTRIKNGEKWQVVKNVSEKSLEKANRFNLNKLLTFCVE